MKIQNVGFTGIGSYIPEKVLTNKDIDSLNIGTDVNDILVKDIKRLTKIIENNNISKRIKKKNEILINRKISNKIDDLHWKSIKYLTHNYKIIF